MRETDARSLPVGWRWEKLSQLLTSLETGSRPKGGVGGITTGVPSISAEHMTETGSFDFSRARFVPRQFYNEMRSGRVVAGDTLVVKDGATTGKCAFVDERFPFDEAVVNEHVFVCRPDAQVVVPRFLFYWLRSPSGYAQVRENYQGAAIGGINQSFADSASVPLPPLDVQRRIVDAVKSKLGAAEQVRSGVMAQLQLASLLPPANLRAVFGTHEADGWPRASLGDVCELLPSRSIASDGDLEVKAVTTACLTEIGFNPAGVKLSRMRSADAASCRLGYGEILVARSNTPDLVGRVAMFSGQPVGAVASDLTIRVRAGEDVEPRFLTGYLSFLFITAYWRERAGGASGSMKKITRTQIQSERIPVPPLCVQVRVARLLELHGRATQNLQAALRKSDDLAGMLPAALLRRAFNGEL